MDCPGLVLIKAYRLTQFPFFNFHLRWIGCLPPHGTHCHVFQVDRWGVYLHMEPIAMLVSPASELVEKELAGDGPTGVMVNPLRVKRKECKVLL